jgi:hypothetical protein
VVTLHDAAYVRRDNLGMLVEVFEQVFTELDFRMTLKVERTGTL